MSETVSLASSTTHRHQKRSQPEDSPKLSEKDNAQQYEASPESSSRKSRRKNTSRRPPGPNDILLGRGRPYHFYAGNQKMLRTISKYEDRYNNTPKESRRAVGEEIVNEILKTGARFLEKVEIPQENDHGDSEKEGTVRKGELRRTGLASRPNFFWKEVSRETAFGKVTHVIRGNRGRPRHSSDHVAAAAAAEETINMETTRKAADFPRGPTKRPSSSLGATSTTTPAVSLSISIPRTSISIEAVSSFSLPSTKPCSYSGNHHSNQHRTATTTSTGQEGGRSEAVAERMMLSFLLQRQEQQRRWNHALFEQQQQLLQRFQAHRYATSYTSNTASGLVAPSGDQQEAEGVGRETAARTLFGDTPNILASMLSAYDAGRQHQQLTQHEELRGGAATAPTWPSPSLLLPSTPAVPPYPLLVGASSSNDRLSGIDSFRQPPAPAQSDPYFQQKRQYMQKYHSHFRAGPETAGFATLPPVIPPPYFASQPAEFSLALLFDPKTAQLLQHHSYPARHEELTPGRPLASPSVGAAAAAAKSIVYPQHLEDCRRDQQREPARPPPGQQHTNISGPSNQELLRLLLDQLQSSAGQR
jgi:hypothetical protein